MLFTYKNHPVLRKIKSQELGFIADLYDKETHDRLMKCKESYQQSWRDIASKIRGKVQLFSKSTIEQILKVKSKLFTVDLINSLTFSERAVIMNGMAYVYRFEIDENHNKTLQYFAFDGEIFLAHAYVTFNTNNAITAYKVNVISYVKEKREFLMDVVYSILLFELFLKFAPIEVKHIGANKKVKDFHGKYCNQTDLDIEIIDSTWFTTLVKSEGFKVRGHFRLQPCGPGLSEKKLIWINDFEKQGYVRHFKRPINLDD